MSHFLKTDGYFLGAGLGWMTFMKAGFLCFLGLGLFVEGDIGSACSPRRG